MSRLGRESNPSFCHGAVFFLSAEAWERVSEHGDRKMAVQALALIGEKERDQQREEETRKFEVCHDQSIRTIFVLCGNSEYLTPSKLQIRFLFWKLMFLIEPIPDASVYVSIQRQMLGCMFFAFEWLRVEIGRDEMFASLVRTANGVSVENLRKTSIA